MSAPEEGSDKVQQNDEEFPQPSEEDTGVEAIIKPEKRPLLYTNKKATRGGRRIQIEPPESALADPDEATLPNEGATPVKARVRPERKAKKGRKTFKSMFTFNVKPRDGKLMRAEEDDSEGEEEDSEEEEDSDDPSQVLEGIIFLLQGLGHLILTGLKVFISFILAACRVLPWTLGIACYLLTVYVAGYYLTEPHTSKEFPDVGSKLVVAFRMSVWLYMPLFLGMLLKAQPPQSGGQPFYQATLMTINLCLLVTQINPVNMHWIEVMARTLSIFEAIRLVSELMKLNTLTDILGMVPRFLIPTLYAYNLYYILCEDFTFCSPPKYTVQELRHQEINQGWSVCSVVENLCGSPAITTREGEL